MILFWAALVLAVAGAPPSLLDAPVQAFRAQNEPRVAALVRFGRENGVRFGVETWAEELAEPISVSVAKGRARDAVKAILGDGWSVSAGEDVVLVRRNGLRPPSWLQLRIPDWKVARTTLAWADANLWMSVEATLDPKRGSGFAGSGPPGSASDLVGPYDIHGATVRSLLCRTLSDSKGGSFVVSGGKVFLGTASVNRFWTLVFYVDR